MASSKPKEGIKEKLKTFFSISREDSADGARSSDRRSSGVHGRSSSISAYISSSVLKSISPGSDTPSRLKHLKELEGLVSTKLLEDGAVENLWLCIQDLVQSTDFIQRNAGIEFMIAICKGQSGRMGLCRLMFFEYLKTVTTINETETGVNILPLYTALLKELCRGGEDVSDFEEELGPFSLTMLYEYLRRGLDALDILNLLQTLIKHQSVYFDEPVLRDIVRYVCIAACRTKSGVSESTDEIIACLNVMEAILRNCCWPKGVLLVVVTALCKLVNVKSLCEHCCQFAGHLLSSHYGHSAVYTMCSLMQAAEMYPDEGVLRGAVYFVGASLWGAQRVENLRHTPGAVLPFILQALASNSVTVAYEVALSMECLIQQFGTDLQLLTWDLVLKILERIFQVADSNQLPPASAVTKMAHDALTLVEKLYENHSFNGSAEDLFNLIEKRAKHRPDGSILRLMDYRTRSLSPCRGNWLSQLHALLDTYYNGDARQNIRLEAVRILRNLFVEHRHLHGDELVEVVVLAVFSEVDRESDMEVQASVINLLVDMTKSSAQNCFYELLAILERVVCGRLETIDLASNRHDLNQFFINIECALGGLIEIAKTKWSSTPATEALHVVDLLTSHAQLQYSRDLCDDLGSSARWTVMKFLLSLGAELGTQKLVYKEPLSGQSVASAYIICADSEQEYTPPHSPITTSAVTGGRMVNFSAKRVIKGFASCIQKERQWSVLRLLLAEMPSFLLSRRLVLADVDGISAICAAAIQLGTDPRGNLPVAQISDNLTADEVKEHVYALLTSLIPYRCYFDGHSQRKLADTIRRGIVNHKSGFAVISAINCLFEMPDIMAPTIPDLVRRLSALPSAPTIAIPVVELLSTLMRMHDMYEKFTVENYEDVLGTLTSYVDPFMLTDYIVAVAYQVIFRWFLRAPLMIRPRLAKHALNRIADIVKKNKANHEKSLDDPLLWRAYEDAREVCITFFAYYSFTDTPPSSDRSPIAQQLFRNNRSRHWIIGDRIFSITPSEKTGGCQNCAQKQLQYSQSMKAQNQESKQDFLDKRRRHASAIQGRVTFAPEPAHRLAADDTCISSAIQNAPGASIARRDFQTDCSKPSGACFCWCQEWIELTVRHAIGRQAWVVRVGDQTNPLVATGVDAMGLLASSGDEISDEEAVEKGPEERPSTGEGNEEGGPVTDLASMISVNNNGDSANNDRNNDQESKPILTIPINRSPNPKDEAPKKRDSCTNSPCTSVPLDLRSVLLQLFSANIQNDLSTDNPCIVSLPDTEAVERSIKNLDRISPYEAHKIGVIYIGSRQTTEMEILKNQFGSPRYEAFLKGLGKLINLKETDAGKVYVGGLDTTGRDGEFTYHWSDQTSQVIFHVATRMPNRDNDQNCQQKKLHIGNDFVTIVFNESGCEYKLSTISGQFARVAIVVQPLDEKILHIRLVAKNEIASWLSMKEATMSDDLAPLLCRQMAIRADASARIWEQQKSTPSGEPVLCRTVERLRQIKSIKERFGGKPLTVTSMFD